MVLQPCPTLCRNSGLISRQSTCGGEIKRCSGCLRYTRNSKKAVQNALRLIRIRYGLPYSELPDLDTSDLSKYLLFLLEQGKVRDSVSFPRRQSKGEDGFCSLQRLGRIERWELAHSLNSIKRNLPLGCVRHTPSGFDSWASRAFSSPTPSDPEYLRFVRREVSKIFHYGWDGRYADFVDRHVPNASSRFNGDRGDHCWTSWKDFRRQCRLGPDDCSPLKGRFKTVNSAGKARDLIILDERVDLLGPLHKMIYRRLMAETWLLVGPPTEDRISRLCEHEVQTSVDLVSATDNLSLEVTEAILGTILRKSALPGGIRLLAMNSLRPLVYYSGQEIGQVSHGQMMGGYLSFPLLCIHSYLAARWASRDVQANFLVNGDDTLISAPRAILSSDYPEGYKLNDIKTIRAKNVAEVNSTAFLRGTSGRWREVRHLRRGAFLTDFQGMCHIASAVGSSVKWTDAFIRGRFGKKWGFLPSQLGLRTDSYPAFCRRREMWSRYHTDLPGLEQLSTSLLWKSGSPDNDELLALVHYQFENGREGGRKRDVFNPTVGDVRKTYRYWRYRLYSYRTYLSLLAERKVPVRRKVERYLVPPDYQSMKEDEGCRLLTKWSASLR